MKFIASGYKAGNCWKQLWNPDFFLNIVCVTPGHKYQMEGSSPQLTKADQHSWGQIRRFIFNLCMLSHFSRIQLFATPWTVARQAPLSMGFSREEYWSGLLCPPPGDLPNPGMEPASPSPALAGGFFTTEPSGKPSRGTRHRNQESEGTDLVPSALGQLANSD